jgi:ABC-type multidrug transport system ATPase subunit
MIQTKDLSKRFGRQQAVDNLSLLVGRGEIYGFLGPNGAGKTTTIRMLLGLTRPDSGQIIINGEKIIPTDTSYRRLIGVVPEKHPSGMWNWMTATEYLQLFCNLFDVDVRNKKIGEALERLQLSEHRNKLIRQFSRGMMQKLSFARAMIHNPDILLLDEPISGLDPYGIHQIRDIILEEHKKGKTIIISSHLLTEIERFCTRIGIIYKGRLVSENTTKIVIDSLVPNRVFRIDIEFVEEQLTKKLSVLPFVQEVSVSENSVMVTVDKDGDYRKELSRFFYEEGFPPLLIQEQALSLEDAFLSLTSLSKEDNL